MAKTKLSITQRRFILSRILHEAYKKQEALITKEKAKLTLDTRLGVRLIGTHEETTQPHEETTQLSVYSDLERDACRAKEEFINRALYRWELPSSWYKKEFDAGHYTVDVVMEECMSRPKCTVTFPNAEKAAKKEKAKFAKRAAKDYDELHILADQVKANVLEFNKWYKNVVIPRVMLCEDGETLLEDLLKAIPK